MLKYNALENRIESPRYRRKLSRQAIARHPAIKIGMRAVCYGLAFNALVFDSGPMIYCRGIGVILLTGMACIDLWHHRKDLAEQRYG